MCITVFYVITFLFTMPNSYELNESHEFVVVIVMTQLSNSFNEVVVSNAPTHYRSN